MLRLLPLLLVVWVGSVRADDDNLFPNAVKLQEAMKDLAPAPAPCDPSGVQLNPEQGYEATLLSFGVNGPLSDEDRAAFCKDAAYDGGKYATCGVAARSCRRFQVAMQRSEKDPHVGHSSCQLSSWHELTGPILEKRWLSPEIRSKVLNFVAKRFADYTGDRSLQEQCCRGTSFPKKCRAQFAAVEPYIDRGEYAPVDAVYHFALKRITFSLRHLMTLANHEEVESLMLHELGHACQDARHTGEKDFVAKINDSKFCGAEAARKAFVPDFYATLSKEKYACIKKEIDQALGYEGCNQGHLLEVFGSIVFSDRLTRAAHWNLRCGSGTAGEASVYCSSLEFVRATCRGAR